MKRLGVNIDHVATIRNARGESHPDPVYAAKFTKKAGADSITIHLREDRRHINDNDAKNICLIKNLLVNLEISTNSRIIQSALKIKPNFICVVPENRKEITTEGGLNLKKNKIKLRKIISKFKKKNKKKDTTNKKTKTNKSVEIASTKPGQTFIKPIFFLFISLCHLFIKEIVFART